MLKRAAQLLALLFFGTCVAQEPGSIRFAKDRQYIYFFQAGKASDTIVKDRSDLFYFLVPDSIQRYVVLHSDNAQFSLSKNDSLVRCTYLPGLRYEAYFLDTNHETPGAAPPMRLKTGINGVATYPREKILIQVVDKRSNKVLLENSFYGR